MNCLSVAEMKYCQHCGCEASLVHGDVIYPHRPDLREKWFYLCQCGAYVGTHPGTTNPLGQPSNAALRKAKSAAHALFDPIWKEGQMGRSAAYGWLGEQLGIPKAHVHIGWFDLETCNRVIEVCRARLLPQTITDSPQAHAGRNESETAKEE